MYLHFVPRFISILRFENRKKSTSSVRIIEFEYKTELQKVVVCCCDCTCVNIKRKRK